jgi:hypothetical protein
VTSTNQRGRPPRDTASLNLSTQLQPVYFPWQRRSGTTEASQRRSTLSSKYRRRCGEGRQKETTNESAETAGATGRSQPPGGGGQINGDSTANVPLLENN